MSRRNVVRGAVLAALIALGTWGALAIAQAPGADDAAGVPDDETPAFMGGPGMGMGHGPGMGMGRAFGRRHGFGRGPGRGFGMGPGRGLLAHAKELGLSAQQRDRLEAIHDAQRRRGIETRKDLELAELDMRKLVRDDTPDRRAIELQIDRIAALRAQLHKARVLAMLDGRDVLTPQQRQKLEELRERGPDDDAGPPPGGGRRPGAGARGR